MAVPDHGGAHLARNQAEFGWRPSSYARQVAAIRRMAEAFNFGRLTIIPYHDNKRGLLGMVRVWSYAERPITYAKGYWGEAFLRLAPMQPLPHPSGLPDQALTRTPTR